MLSKRKIFTNKDSEFNLKYNFSDVNVPKYKLRPTELSPRDSYELIHDEMFFEANPRLNMATFVTTYMEPEAVDLMKESFQKNYIDKPIYPQTMEIQERCVSILADLFHGEEDASGVATVGSSEAIHLAGLTMKWNWKNWYKEKYGTTPSKFPNIIMGSNVQVCWKKFCKYFDVELIDLPLDDDNKLDVQKVIKSVDEYTIGVVGILGNTYTGEFDDISKLNRDIDIVNTEKKLNIPIHVDAASGGFVAPFANVHANLVWDFRLKNVNSINVSGHKYGMVYPGVGWAIWKSEKLIPKDLVFQIKYLGEAQDDFGLNFSRGSSQILGQYYNFVRYGREGYEKKVNNLINLYDKLKNRIEQIKVNNKKVFKIENHDKGLPLVAVSLQNEFNKEIFNLDEISHKVKEKGWVLPVYPMSEPKENIEIMRIVIRNGFSLDMLDKLIEDIKWALNELNSENRNYLANGSHGVC